MSIVQNIISPVLQLMVYIFLIGGLCFATYRIFKDKFKDFPYWFKYKIMRKKIDQEKREFCLLAWEEDVHELDIKKNMFLDGKSFAEVNDILYIYQIIKAEMKGGVRK